MNLQEYERKWLQRIDVIVRHVLNSESQTVCVCAKIWNHNLRKTKQDLGFP